MWFIGDNEQRRDGSIERLPEGPGHTTTICYVPVPHRCAVASLSSLRLASGHRMPRRNPLQSPDWTLGLGQMGAFSSGMQEEQYMRTRREMEEVNVRR